MTLNLDGTPRKKHKKGAGRPTKGRTWQAPRLTTEAGVLCKRLAKIHKLDFCETLEKGLQALAFKLLAEKEQDASN